MLILFYVSWLALLLLFFPSTLCITLSMGQYFVLTGDSNSFLFMFTLFIVSSSVLSWSYFYMSSELEYRRFFGLVLVFLISIIMLVFSADLLALFVAWDLLGFSSFFLVVFFRTRPSLGGGLLTCLTNRVGDVLLLAFFGLNSYSSVSMGFGQVTLLLFVAFTNSAQVPFSSWLPAAMLAPTPVSALVHSSTLVTAGVYLLIRFYPSECRLLVFVGSFTILLAGIAACLECDTKNIIALSTLSQLGLIMFSLGLGKRSLCFAHLNTHAAFNALLFMAVGTVIHAVYGNQESRSCAVLAYSSPLMITTLVVSLLSMCGVFFFSGWVTKEAILESCLNSSSSLFSFILFYLGIGLTISYCLRLILLLVSVSKTANTCSTSFSVGYSSKLPMLGLLLLAVIQGSTLWLNIYWPPSFLSQYDKLTVGCVFLVTASFYSSLIASLCKSPNVFMFLSYTVEWASGLAVGATTISSTETSYWHGFGLGSFPSIISHTRSLFGFCNNGLVILFLVALVI